MREISRQDEPVNFTSGAPARKATSTMDMI